MVPFNGVFSYRSDTFTHEIRKVGDRAFLVGNESDDPAMCSFVISTEDDDVEYDDDFDARARYGPIASHSSRFRAPRSM